jgi:acyl dehydratase
MPTVFENVDALAAAAGRDLGHTEWVTIDQDRINRFADATGDHQWIHVDVDAAKDGPFGGTIAHGYLTLSLTNLFLPELIQVENISMGINYGVNKVRFPSPVLAGSRVRGAARLGTVEEVAGGVQALINVTVEIEGQAKPACVVENVTRYLR